MGLRFYFILTILVEVRKADGYCWWNARRIQSVSAIVIRWVVFIAKTPFKNTFLKMFSKIPL